jgi:hypothetical protein
MSPWHFIHPLMDEIYSYLLNLVTTILQLDFDQKNSIFFIHALMNGWMNETYIFVATILQLKKM